jgi:hypothetical protein
MGKESSRNWRPRLTGEFGKGFSASNLASMRAFCLVYEDRGASPPLQPGLVPLRAPPRSEEPGRAQLPRDRRHRTELDRARTPPAVQFRPVRAPCPEPRQRGHSPPGAGRANRGARDLMKERLGDVGSFENGSEGQTTPQDRLGPPEEFRSATPGICLPSPVS